MILFGHDLAEAMLLAAALSSHTLVARAGGNPGTDRFPNGGGEHADDCRFPLGDRQIPDLCKHLCEGMVFAYTNSNIRSAVRVLESLETLSVRRSPVRLGQLAQDLSISKSSMHGLLVTLVNRGYVQRDDADRYGVAPLAWTGWGSGRDRLTMVCVGVGFEFCG